VSQVQEPVLESAEAAKVRAAGAGTPAASPIRLTSFVGSPATQTVKLRTHLVPAQHGRSAFQLGPTSRARAV
jgi:hypothetical protein